MCYIPFPKYWHRDIPKTWDLVFSPIQEPASAPGPRQTIKNAGDGIIAVEVNRLKITLQPGQSVEVSASGNLI